MIENRFYKFVGINFEDHCEESPIDFLLQFGARQKNRERKIVFLILRPLFFCLGNQLSYSNWRLHTEDSGIARSVCRELGNLPRNAARCFHMPEASLVAPTAA